MFVNFHFRITSLGVQSVGLPFIPLSIIIEPCLTLSWGELLGFEPVSLLKPLDDTVCQERGIHRDHHVANAITFCRPT